jgi:hypothetical protein
MSPPNEKGAYAPKSKKEGVGTPSFRNRTSVGGDYNDDAQASVKQTRARELRTLPQRRELYISSTITARAFAKE